MKAKLIDGEKMLSKGLMKRILKLYDAVPRHVRMSIMLHPKSQIEYKQSTSGLAGFSTTENGLVYGRAYFSVVVFKP